MFLAAEWRGHNPACGVIPIGVFILAVIQNKMLDQRFTKHTFAVLACATDGLVSRFTRHMHDIQRHIGHICNHDCTVTCFALNIHGAGIGVRLRPVIAFSQQLLLQGRDHVAVFGMDQRHCPQFGTALEGCKHFIIIDHQRALIGHEVLKGVDALFLYDDFHFVKDLLAPPGRRHMEGIITNGFG